MCLKCALKMQVLLVIGRKFFKQTPTTTLPLNSGDFQVERRAASE